LVRDYIKQPDCLILVAINMAGNNLLIQADEDDIENQGAAKLARDVDPHGERTIGILFYGVTEM
jgi:hypothetical protein